MAGIDTDNVVSVDYNKNGDVTYVTIDRKTNDFISQDEKDAAAEIADSVVDYADGILFGDIDLLSTTDSDNSGICTAVPCKVEYVYETVTRTVKYGKQTVYSSKLDKGKTTTTKGKNGEKEVTYLKKLINGKVVESEVYSEKVTVEPVAEIVTIGTKVNLSAGATQTNFDVKCISTLVPSKPIQLDANGIPVNYTKLITGKGTAYYTGKYCSTGVIAQPGYVAVNPKQIPYGTKMYIVSADGRYVYGYAIAADTGGFATNGSGTIVDLRFNTRSECYTFGRRNVNIYILE